MKIHIEDSDFALKEGLLPKAIATGKIKDQFIQLGEKAEISEKTIAKIFKNLTSHEEKITDLIYHSFLSEKLKRNYLQSYQRKVKRLK